MLYSRQLRTHLYFRGCAVNIHILQRHVGVVHSVTRGWWAHFYSIPPFLTTRNTERTSTNTLHTVQLSSLYRAGGLDAIFDVCQAFMSTIKVIMAIKAEDRSEQEKKELVHAYGGMKVALHLIHPIIASKPLFESGQTLLVLTRDKKDTDPEYFEPHNFLVRLRLAALPVLRSLWEAPWLISAPLSVSRSVVQTVLELTNGENEESKGDPSVEIVPTPSSIPRPTSADEGHIQILTDMGFPRSAAERALARTHNNVGAATELLLSHPFPLPPDPEPESAAPVPAEEGVPAPVAATVAEDVELESPPAPPVEEEHTPATVAPTVVVGKGTEEWRKELNEAREPLRASISRQALLLVDEHVSLLFDLHVAFIRPANDHQKRAVQDLVDDIKAFSPSAYDVQEQPLANRCRLLALVLCETPSSLNQELRALLLDSLLALLLSNPASLDPIPQWLAAHLLVTEALFTLADEPKAITLPKEAEPMISEAISVGPPLIEARGIVFDFCLRLLAIPNLRSDELLSTLRLLVLLTRDQEMASQFVHRDGLAMLFKRIKASEVPGSASYIASILRHTIEDAQTVQHLMRQAIKRYFAQPRTRVVEIGTYVRNCSAMALRDSHIFIKVTEAMCLMGQPFSPSPHISLKAEPPADDKTSQKTDAGGDNNADMQVDSPPVAAPSSANESTESVVHFLISELMTVVKTINETPPHPTTSQQDPDVAPVERIPEGPQVELPGTEGATGSSDLSIYDQYQYSCFLMQCLTELLFSYDSCKLAFLSYSPKKRLTTPAKESSNKHRAATLQFLLSELISFGTINPQPNNRARNRITLCNWAMSVIVALCVDSSSTHEHKDVSADLASVRKFILEAVSRTIKDPQPSENVESRYGRLLALADLCHRLLTVRFNTVSRKQQDDTPTHIAKVMLEKNFVATLTAALSEVDLNYPNVRGLAASILRPLEYL